MLNLSEAETQLLIAMIECSDPIETPNNNFYKFYPKTMQEAASYFKGSQVDWSPAYPLLEQRKWIMLQSGQWVLTDEGQAIARQVRLAHPPIYYWYRQFYTLTATSQAYARFCEKLYGKNLGQANFSDMDQVQKLVDTIGLKPDSQALDLGCGAGFLAEYLSDISGARLWGVDYSPEAIQRALARTGTKRSRLNFKVGNLDSLNFPDRSFETILSVDTLYMPNDLNRTLQQILDLLRPNGQLAVFYSQYIWDAPDGRNSLKPGNTVLAAALKAKSLPFRTWDFTEQTYHHLQRKHRLGNDMRPEFEAEGTLALHENIMAESESSDAPYDPTSCIFARYLYHIQTSAI
jgi:SAM-dependent methyltransferase